MLTRRSLPRHFDQGANTMATTYGFRIVGACNEERRLVDWRAAFSGYASLDERIDTSREAYLSAFTFGDDFRSHLDTTGSTKGFNGPCGAEYLWFDIDRTDLEAARLDAARLVSFIVERYGLDEDGLLIFFSGSKGFHIGLPADLWKPLVSVTFCAVARRLAEGLAASARVVVDSGVYDRVRAFRAPNSRHPKTGRHKLALTFNELTRLSVERIQELAGEPMPFDLPPVSARCEQAGTDWQEAARLVEKETEAARERRATGNGSGKLNRSTLNFIRDGAGAGDRHRLLFSAAANLAEFSNVSELAHALLMEAALDSGLSPSETRRQIDCGLNHSKGMDS